MKRRILRNMCALALVAIFLSSALVSGIFFSLFNSQMHKEIQTQTAYLAVGLNQSVNKIEFLRTSEIQNGSTRVTLVAKNGTVLFDNMAQAENMDNHLSRPEIAEALEDGSAQSVHRSKTLGSQTFYYAIRLDDGAIIRLASTTGNFFTALIRSVFPFIILITAVVFVLALILAKRMTERIITPINTLDLEKPSKSSVYEELLPLISRIKTQNRQIKQQMDDLRAKQEDFAAITSHMSEGLIVIDGQANILTVNPSAIHLISAEKNSYEGKNILTLSRNLTLHRAAETALGGDHFDDVLAIKNRTCQLFASPVYEDEAVKGAILLVMDITEQQKAERMRREFSANVSHELKTPLTSISGYAELLKNGMVKAEDISTFSERIYTEASRLIALINDIIKLSGLDEKNVQPAHEEVDLLELAKLIAVRLHPQATEKNILIQVLGDPVKIYAEKHMLDELISNLCENAIKYNKPQGKVEIQISNQNEHAVLTVSDTGIGIPKEHHSRVFERFYRVDKSHSKQTGGTGLGLSIVKHIAEYHKGKIKLESQENQGTKITVTFPKNI